MSARFCSGVMNRYFLHVEIDDQGHLILPPNLMKRLGFLPGANIRIDERANSISIYRSSASLARVYVEPTNLCNLDCQICMRNVWDEPLGKMSATTFSQIIEALKTFSPTPLLFFGGFGEPLAHPDILDMVSAAKRTGAKVEMVTNGTLLSETVSQRLIDIGMDRLWVSIDGATPESYEDIRLGDALPQVIANLTRLRELRHWSEFRSPQIGIAFVAMKRNIADLPEVVKLGKRLGVDQFSISNVLPHTPELQEQILFSLSMFIGDVQPSKWTPMIALPRIDINELTKDRLVEILKRQNPVSIIRQEIASGANTCPFIEKGSVSIRWDGAVSPCLPLLHTHVSYLDDRLRKSNAYAVGNINENSLADLWNSSSYVALRERLQIFDFSPCTFCNSCEMANGNIEDCFGNNLPACGGCLWAQGFIQCP